MSVEHGQRRQCVPCHIPHHLLPSLDLNIVLNGEWSSTFLPYVGEFYEFFLFQCWIHFGTWEDANVSVFRGFVFYHAGRVLDSTNPSLVELVIVLEYMSEVTLPRSLG